MPEPQTVMAIDRHGIDPLIAQPLSVGMSGKRRIVAHLHVLRIKVAEAVAQFRKIDTSLMILRNGGDRCHLVTHLVIKLTGLLVQQRKAAAELADPYTLAAVHEEGVCV